MTDKKRKQGCLREVCQAKSLHKKNKKQKKTRNNIELSKFITKKIREKKNEKRTKRNR